MKKLMAALMTISSLAFAAPPAAQPQAQATQSGWGDKGEKQEMRREDFEKRMRLMLVVGIAENLNLSETEAIRLADKMKVFEDQRKPLREQMHDSMQILKAASDGDQAALGKVDQATATVFDTRAQLAAVDKQMFLTVSKDLTPQKRAQLAIFLAKFMQHAQGMKHEGMGGGGEGFGGRGGRRHVEQ
jgi:Spy/CpxP family protein refolding chaperone